MRQHRYITAIAIFFSILIGQNPIGFEVKGTAVYKSGTLLENAEVTLLDTTDKVIAQTKHRKKY